MLRHRFSGKSHRSGIRESTTLLPEIRSIEAFRLLLETYLRFLCEHGVKRVHAQVVTFNDRRGFKLFERYGFKVLNRSEFTKYKRLTSQHVYLCTILKELHEQRDRLLYPVRGVADRGEQKITKEV